MKKYIVTLTEDGEESICGRYNDIEAAKNYLTNVRYYPGYSRTMESLDIDEDGMSGSGQDYSGHFTYNIKEVIT